VNAAEIIRHQNFDSKYDFYDYKLAEDNDSTPRLLLGSEFAANSYINSPNTKIRVNDNFKNTVTGVYSEMVMNYYKYLSPEQYTYSLTEQANTLFREQLKVGYTIPWTVLTHAELSKDIETGNVGADVKKSKSFSAYVNCEGTLKVNYFENNGKTKIKVVDVSGRVLQTISVNGPGNYSSSINGFRHGIYFVIAQVKN
ncbi:MAG: T9SS type A sorting domain-containing protein, partial [Bacteroidota bacterium]|nr:T9SS type A sorting domain-containing protein [Bacteroidota bacterium]